MKVLSSLFFCALLFAIVFFSLGCASVTTWEEAGVETCRVNDAEIKKMGDGSFQLEQNVIVTKEYFPFIPFFSKSSCEKKVYFYSVKGEIDKSTAYVFLLKPDNKKSTVLSMGKGFFFCKEHLSCLQNSLNFLRDSDISLLEKNPFIVRNLISYKDTFLIPYDVVPRENGVLELKCYSPQSPPVILGCEGNDTYRSRMDGAGITFLRIALLPIPVVIDVVTLPFQAVGLLLVYSLRC